MKTVDFSAAINNDKILDSAIVNKRPNSSRQQPVKQRVLKHVSSMTKEDF